MQKVHQQIEFLYNAFEFRLITNWQITKTTMRKINVQLSGGEWSNLTLGHHYNKFMTYKE